MEKQYLEETKMLNYGAESIQALIQSRKWQELDDYHKIARIYDFVRNEIVFGYNRSDRLTAEEVLKDGYGQCNTKATLLLALLRGVGIPCRLHGAEVLYDEKWIALEGVITDEDYIKAVKNQFKDVIGPFSQYAIAGPQLEGLDLDWNGKDTFVQKDAVVADYGTFGSVK